MVEDIHDPPTILQSNWPTCKLIHQIGLKEKKPLHSEICLSNTAGQICMSDKFDNVNYF